MPQAAPTASKELQEHLRKCGIPKLPFLKKVSPERFSCVAQDSLNKAVDSYALAATFGEGSSLNTGSAAEPTALGELRRQFVALESQMQNQQALLHELERGSRAQAQAQAQEHGPALCCRPPWRCNLERQAI